MNKWLAVIPAEQQAALYAELTALLTPPETHVRVEPFTSETTGRRIVLVKLGAYTFDLSPEEAIRLGHDFMKAATP